MPPENESSQPVAPDQATLRPVVSKAKARRGPRKGKPITDTTPEQAVLRAALNTAKTYVKPAKIVELAEKSGAKLFTAKSLANFLDAKTNNLTKGHYDILATTWLHTPLGRALRNLGKPTVPTFDQLTAKLAGGGMQHPDNPKVAGAYFMYHGSYLIPDRYVVRVIRIDAGDDHILTVTDMIRDGVTLGERDRTAEGVLIFEDKRPQILLSGDENKRGLSLIIGHESNAPDKVLTLISGAFIVMRKGGEVAYRRCLLIREPDGDPQKMMEESGIFPAAEFQKPEREKHRKAFELLNRLVPDGGFADPILKWEAGSS